jgi:hypothetical protein
VLDKGDQTDQREIAEPGVTSTNQLSHFCYQKEYSLLAKPSKSLHPTSSQREKGLSTILTSGHALNQMRRRARTRRAKPQSTASKLRLEKRLEKTHIGARLITKSGVNAVIYAEVHGALHDTRPSSKDCQ